MPVPIPMPMPTETTPRTESAKRARALESQVAAAIARGGEMRVILKACAQAVVTHFDAAFARIWTLEPGDAVLELQASAGMYTHIDGAHARVRVGAFKIGRIAEERLPHLTNDVANDPRVADREWARQNGLVAFAGYPLTVGDRLFGVLAIFARAPLSHDALDALRSVADLLAVTIDDRTRIKADPRLSPAENEARAVATLNEARFRFLADAIPHQVWTATTDGGLDYVNQRVLDYFGRTYAQMIGQGWLDMLHPDDVDTCIQRWTHSLSTGDPYEFEFRLWSVHERRYRWHVAGALPRRDEGGRIIQWFGTNTDIDGRRRIEDAQRTLIEAGRMLASSLDYESTLKEVARICVPALADWCAIDLMAGDGTMRRAWVAQRDPTRADLARKLAQFHPRSEHHLGTYVAQNLTSRWVEEMTDVQLDEASSCAEHRQVLGEISPYSVILVPLTAVDKLIGVMTLFTTAESGRRYRQHDVALAEEIGRRVAIALENGRYLREAQSAAVARQAALRLAEFERKRLEVVFEQAPAAICSTRGPEHRFETANSLYRTLIGNRDLVGKTVAEALPELAGQGFLELLDGVYQTGVPYVGNALPVKLDRGGPVPDDRFVDVIYQGLLDEDGHVEGIMVFALDVTDQVIDRRRVEELASERAAVLGQIEDGVVVTDADGVITFLNDSAKRLHGVGADVPRARYGDVFDIRGVDGAPLESGTSPLTRAAHGEKVVGAEWIIHRRDGTRVTAEGSATPVIAEDGRRIGAVLSVRDVSMQRALESERARLFAALERTNQELDQFAYVASHDLKAPLRGIGNLSQWIEEGLGEKMDDEGREHLRLLRGRVARMEALIDGILSYARAGKSRDKVDDVDLGQLLSETLELLAIPETTTITVGPGMPTLRAARIPLQQVFMNLVGNALKHAARDGARVDIVYRDAGLFHEIAVRDNGPGIAPEFHERIWGMFQTLEARDKVEGTGIGLSVVKKIVETRGGRVSIDSAEGAGATFLVYWPKYSKES